MRRYGIQSLGTKIRALSYCKVHDKLCVVFFEGNSQACYILWVSLYINVYSTQTLGKGNS